MYFWTFVLVYLYLYLLMNARSPPHSATPEARHASPIRHKHAKRATGGESSAAREEHASYGTLSNQPFASAAAATSLSGRALPLATLHSHRIGRDSRRRTGGRRRGRANGSRTSTQTRRAPLEDTQDSGRAQATGVNASRLRRLYSSNGCRTQERRDLRRDKNFNLEANLCERWWPPTPERAIYM